MEEQTGDASGKRLQAAQKLVLLQALKLRVQAGEIDEATAILLEELLPSEHWDHLHAILLATRVQAAVHHLRKDNPDWAACLETAALLLSDVGERNPGEAKGPLGSQTFSQACSLRYEALCQDLAYAERRFGLDPDAGRGAFAAAEWVTQRYQLDALVPALQAAVKLLEQDLLECARHDSGHQAQAAAAEVPYTDAGVGGRQQGCGLKLQAAPGPSVSHSDTTLPWAANSRDSRAQTLCIAASTAMLGKSKPEEICTQVREEKPAASVGCLEATTAGPDSQPLGISSAPAEHAAAARTGEKGESAEDGAQSQEEASKADAISQGLHPASITPTNAPAVGMRLSLNISDAEAAQSEGAPAHENEKDGQACASSADAASPDDAASLTCKAASERLQENEGSTPSGGSLVAPSGRAQGQQDTRSIVNSIAESQSQDGLHAPAEDHVASGAAALPPKSLSFRPRASADSASLLSGQAAEAESAAVQDQAAGAGKGRGCLDEETEIGFPDAAKGVSHGEQGAAAAAACAPGEDAEEVQEQILPQRSATGAAVQQGRNGLGVLDNLQGKASQYHSQGKARASRSESALTPSTRTALGAAQPPGRKRSCSLLCAGPASKPPVCLKDSRAGEMVEGPLHTLSRSAEGAATLRAPAAGCSKGDLSPASEQLLVPVPDGLCIQSSRTQALQNALVSKEPADAPDDKEKENPAPAGLRLRKKRNPCKSLSDSSNGRQSQAAGTMQISQPALAANPDSSCAGSQPVAELTGGSSALQNTVLQPAKQPPRDSAQAESSHHAEGPDVAEDRAEARTLNDASAAHSASGAVAEAMPVVHSHAMERDRGPFEQTAAAGRGSDSTVQPLAGTSTACAAEDSQPGPSRSLPVEQTAPGDMGRPSKVVLSSAAAESSAQEGPECPNISAIPETEAPGDDMTSSGQGYSGLQRRVSRKRRLASSTAASEGPEIGARSSGDCGGEVREAEPRKRLCASIGSLREIQGRQDGPPCSQPGQPCGGPAARVHQEGATPNQPLARARPLSSTAGLAALAFGGGKRPAKVVRCEPAGGGLLGLAKQLEVRAAERVAQGLPLVGQAHATHPVSPAAAAAQRTALQGQASRPPVSASCASLHCMAEVLPRPAALPTGNSSQGVQAAQAQPARRPVHHRPRNLQGATPTSNARPSQNAPSQPSRPSRRRSAIAANAPDPVFSVLPARAPAAAMTAPEHCTGQANGGVQQPAQSAARGSRNAWPTVGDQEAEQSLSAGESDGALSPGQPVARVSAVVAAAASQAGRGGSVSTIPVIVPRGFQKANARANMLLRAASARNDQPHPAPETTAPSHGVQSAIAEITTSRPQPLLPAQQASASQQLRHAAQQQELSQRSPLLATAGPQASDLRQLPQAAGPLHTTSLHGFVGQPGSLQSTGAQSQPASTPGGAAVQDACNTGAGGAKCGVGEASGVVAPMRSAAGAPARIKPARPRFAAPDYAQLRRQRTPQVQPDMRTHETPCQVVSGAAAGPVQSIPQPALREPKRDAQPGASLCMPALHYMQLGAGSATHTVQPSALASASLPELQRSDLFTANRDGQSAARPDGAFLTGTPPWGAQIRGNHSEQVSRGHVLVPHELHPTLPPRLGLEAMGANPLGPSFASMQEQAVIGTPEDRHPPAMLPRAPPFMHGSGLWAGSAQTAAEGLLGSCPGSARQAQGWPQMQSSQQPCRLPSNGNPQSQLMDSCDVGGTAWRSYVQGSLPAGGQSASQQAGCVGYLPECIALADVSQRQQAQGGWANSLQAGPLPPAGRAQPGGGMLQPSEPGAPSSGIWLKGTSGATGSMAAGQTRAQAQTIGSPAGWRLQGGPLEEVHTVYGAQLRRHNHLGFPASLLRPGFSGIPPVVLLQHTQPDIGSLCASSASQGLEQTWNAARQGGLQQQPWEGACAPSMPHAEQVGQAFAQPQGTQAFLADANRLHFCTQQSAAHASGVAAARSFPQAQPQQHAALSQQPLWEPHQGTVSMPKSVMRLCQPGKLMAAQHQHTGSGEPAAVLGVPVYYSPAGHSNANCAAAAVGQGLRSWGQQPAKVCRPDSSKESPSNALGCSNVNSHQELAAKAVQPPAPQLPEHQPQLPAPTPRLPEHPPWLPEHPPWLPEHQPRAPPVHGQLAGRQRPSSQSEQGHLQQSSRLLRQLSGSQACENLQRDSGQGLLSTVHGSSPVGPVRMEAPIPLQRGVSRPAGRWSAIEGLLPAHWASSRGDVRTNAEHGCFYGEGEEGSPPSQVSATEKTPHVRPSEAPGRQENSQEPTGKRDAQRRRSSAASACPEGFGAGSEACQGPPLQARPNLSMAGFLRELNGASVGGPVLNGGSGLAAPMEPCLESAAKQHLPEGRPAKKAKRVTFAVDVPQPGASPEIPSGPLRTLSSPPADETWPRLADGSGSKTGPALRCLQQPVMHQLPGEPLPASTTGAAPAEQDARRCQRGCLEGYRRKEQSWETTAPSIARLARSLRQPNARKLVLQALGADIDEDIEEMKG